MGSKMSEKIAKDMTCADQVTGGGDESCDDGRDKAISIVVARALGGTRRAGEACYDIQNPRR